MSDVQPTPETLERIKALLRRDLKMGDQTQIDDDMALAQGDLDIDSLDILLLLTSVEKEFGIKIPNEDVGEKVFVSVRTLAAYVDAQRAASGG